MAGPDLVFSHGCRTEDPWLGVYFSIITLFTQRHCMQCPPFVCLPHTLSHCRIKQMGGGTLAVREQQVIPRQKLGATFGDTDTMETEKQVHCPGNSSAADTRQLWVILAWLPGMKKQQRKEQEKTMKCLTLYNTYVTLGLLETIHTAVTMGTAPVDILT